jgi:hypothetical protein
MKAINSKSIKHPNAPHATLKNLDMTFSADKLRNMSEGTLLKIIILDYQLGNENIKADDALASVMGITVQSLSNIKADKGHLGYRQLREL